MIISDWLTENIKKLKDASVATARLDCLVLLEDATGINRAYLLAHPETSVTGPTCHKLNEQVKRRAKHEPLAYIRGKTEFYGREFIINKHVLEPRPESETMIELLKQLIGQRAEGRGQSVVDIGTGCGALGITAKLEFPDTEVVLTDIDPNCLKVARQNTKKHKVNVTFIQGNLLEPLFALSPPPFALLCNLLYVPDSHVINKAAMNEPRVAIFGGPDGLDLYRQLFTQLSINKQFTSVKYVLTESLPPQHPALSQIAKNHGFKQYKEDDFIQVFEKS